MMNSIDDNLSGIKSYNRNESEVDMSMFKSIVDQPVSLRY